MNTYHIYYNGRHLDTIHAYNTCGAIAHFVDDNPSYAHVVLETMQVVIP